MTVEFVALASLVAVNSTTELVGPGTTVLVPSSSSNANYEVRFFAHEGAWELSCTCQSWKYQKREIWDRTCKHTSKVHKLLYDLDQQGHCTWYFDLTERVVADQYETVLVGTFEFPDDLPDWA